MSGKEACSDKRKTVGIADFFPADLFYRIVEQAADIIIVSDVCGKILYANKAALTAYGYSRDVFLNLRIHDLLSLEMQHELDGQIKETHKERLLFRVVNMRKNGEAFPLEVSFQRVCLGNEEVLLSIARDITEIVEAERVIKNSEEKYRLLHEDLMTVHEELTASEENLRQQFAELMATKEILRISEEKFSKAFHLSPDAVGINRLADGLFIEVNHGFTCMTGYSREEALGKTSLELDIWTDPQDREVIIDELQKYGEVRNMEVLFRHKDGSNFYGSFSANKIDVDGEGCLLIVVRDITRSKQMEEELRQSEKRFRTIFEASNDGIFLLGLNKGEMVDVNEKACELRGYTRDEIFSGEYELLGTAGPPYDKKEALRRIRLAADGKPQVFEWKDRHRDGRYIWEEVSLKRIAIGTEEYIIALVRDISERKKAEMELNKSQANNKALINAIPDSMFIIGSDGTILNFKASKEHPYLLSDAFIGKTVFDIFTKDVASKIAHGVNMALMSRDIQSIEFSLVIKGQTEHHEARIVVCSEKEVLLICRNITERKEMEKKLRILSLHDALTGLYNRAFFEEQIKSMQSNYGNIAGLIICDVDGLKVINDTLGQGMGDIVLKEVANILTATFVHGELIARIGGDEFAVFLPNTSKAELKACCNRIRDLINSYNHENLIVPISLSMGYAAGKEAAVDVDTLFKEADNYMYREKLHRQKSVRSPIVLALMKALEARDFLTEGHGDRLENSIQSFAGIIGVPESSIADLRLFAHFHDIGKVGISDNILFKPGPLSAEEWEVMRGHCEIGYRIAMSTPVLEPIADWILKHHEWWNGNGYPLGLKGEEIPLACRILAIVDAYDAMTSDRPYRKAMSKEEAIAELKCCEGIQFDPELVRMYILMLNRD